MENDGLIKIKRIKICIIKKNDYTVNNWQVDRLLLWSLSTTEWEMRQTTHAEGGLGNRGPNNAHLGRVSSSDTANFFYFVTKSAFIRIL